MPTVFDTPYIPNPRKPKAPEVHEPADVVRQRLWQQHVDRIAKANADRKLKRSTHLGAEKAAEIAYPAEQEAPAT